MNSLSPISNFYQSKTILASPVGSQSLPPDAPKFLQTQRILCGAMAGAVTKTIIAPLERVKIIHQTQGMILQQGGKMEYHSILQSITHILRTEGLRSLWNGNGANVLRVIPNYGLRFSFNDKARELVLKMTGSSYSDENKHQLNKSQLFLAGSLAGIAQITITYPAEVIFTRLTLSGSKLTHLQYSGIMDCLMKTLRAEGVGALYNGYLCTLLAGTPYVALQMGCYEIFQRNLSPLSGYFQSETPTKLISGALAGLVAQKVTFPGDVLRKRMQSDGMNGKPKLYKGVWHGFKTIYRQEGLRGFFEGAKVNTWRCLPEGAITFFILDGMKSMLDISKYDAR